MSKARANVMTLEKMRSVRDFGAVLDGIVNDKAAFDLAIADIPVGETGEILVDGIAYLATATSNAGRYPTFVFRANAGICTVPGGAVGGEASRLSWPVRWTKQVADGSRYEYSVNPPNVTADFARHEYIQITGNAAALGTTQGVGIRKDYRAFSHGSGFDIAEETIGIWQRSSGDDGGFQLANWLVSISPTVGGATTRWGQFVSEMNVVNRFGDSGWSAKRATLDNWSGILQLVPEGNLFGQTGVSYNSLFHVLIGKSTTNKADGIPGQSWNGVLMEPNAICGDGYGGYWSGNDSGTAARNPKAALALAETWKTGLALEAAIYTTTRAISMAVGHVISWITGGVEKSSIGASVNGLVLTPTPPNYADDAAAATGTVPVGGVYRNGSILMVRVV